MSYNTIKVLVSRVSLDTLIRLYLFFVLKGGENLSLPTDEQETVIQFDRNGSGAIIDTSDSKIITKLERLVNKSVNYHLDEIHYCKGEEVGRRYSVDDKKLISFRSQKVKRNLTDEQKEKMAERLRASRV